MKNANRALAISLLLLSTLFAALWGEQKAIAKPRFALVIGNSAYSGDAALKNPVNDATDMAAALRKVGWDVSLATDVDRKAFNKAVFGFRDKLAGSEGAQALFFFAGHGIQVEGENYLVPVKVDFESVDDIKIDSTSVKSVTEAIGEGKADISIVILDACRDNPFAKKMTRSLGGARGAPEGRRDLGLSRNVLHEPRRRGHGRERAQRALHGRPAQVRERGPQDRGPLQKGDGRGAAGLGRQAEPLDQREPLERRLLRLRRYPRREGGRGR
jgi:hypothetical protein